MKLAASDPGLTLSLYGRLVQDTVALLRADDDS